MKNLVFVLVAMFLFSGFAMAERKEIRCRMLGCSDTNTVGLVCYGDDNKTINTSVDGTRVRINGVEIYNDPLNSGNIQRGVVTGPTVIQQKKNLKGWNILSICKDLQSFCSINGIGSCKVARMMYSVTPTDAICDISDTMKKNCF